MKKSILTIAALLLAFAFEDANACTNFLVTKGASTDGSCFISYAADSHSLYGELYHYPAADYPEGAKLSIYEWDTGRYLGQIPQVRHTYNVVGNMNEWQLAIGETTYGGLENMENKGGIVDYGNLIYITLQRAKNAREAIKVMAELVAKYGYPSSGESFSIADPEEVWILEMIGKGTNMKTTKKGKTYNANKGAVWVARRIPDGYISGHANLARITTFPLATKSNPNSITSKEFSKIFDPNIDCVYSHDVISFAKENKLYDGPDDKFSFSDVYNPVDFGGARFCDLRVWAMFNRLGKEDMSPYWDYATGRDIKRAKEIVKGKAQTPKNFPTNRMPLWVKPKQKVSVLDVMACMRDHLEGTELDMAGDVGAGPFACPYRWRPMEWEVDGQKYIHERTTATQQTGFSFVAQCRATEVPQIGGIIWFGVDDCASTVYCPMYTCMNRIPSSYAVGNGSMTEWSETSAFWTFNQMTNWAYTKYNYIHPEIEQRQKQYEEGWVKQIKQIDEAALRIYRTNPQEAVAYLTRFSCDEGNRLVSEWKTFYHQLFMKYVDGNLNSEQPVPKGQKYTPIRSEHPEYSKEFYRNIIKETGDKYKVY